MRLCSVEGCDRKHVARGFCGGHYQRMKAGADMAPPIGEASRQPSPRRKPLAVYFWERVNKNGPTQHHMDTPCWLWTGQVAGRGYGVARSKMFRVKAHRASWELHNGPIPEGADVLHACDVKTCVNPEHLHLGNDAANSAEAWARGRKLPVRGERQGGAKLTDSDVYAIRRRGDGGEAHTAIAADYPVGPSAVRRIVNRQRWTHLPEVTDV